MEPTPLPISFHNSVCQIAVPVPTASSTHFGHYLGPAPICGKWIVLESNVLNENHCAVDERMQLSLSMQPLCKRERKLQFTSVLANTKRNLIKAQFSDKYIH